MRIEHSIRFGVSAACHATGHKPCTFGLAYADSRVRLGTSGSRGRAQP